MSSSSLGGVGLVEVVPAVLVEAHVVAVQQALEELRDLLATLGQVRRDMRATPQTTVDGVARLGPRCGQPTVEEPSAWATRVIADAQADADAIVAAARADLQAALLGGPRPVPADGGWDRAVAAPASPPEAAPRVAAPASPPEAGPSVAAPAIAVHRRPAPIRAPGVAGGVPPVIDLTSPTGGSTSSASELGPLAPESEAVFQAFLEGGDERPVPEREEQAASRWWLSPMDMALPMIAVFVVFVVVVATLSWFG